MFRSTISEKRRRTVPALLFLCALVLSAILSGATESTDKTVNKNFSAGRTVSGGAPTRKLGPRGTPKTSRRDESMPSFLGGVPRRNLPLTMASAITVNSTAQSPGAAGDCTLGEAIIAANTDSPVDGCSAGLGQDTIILPAGTYTLSAVDNDFVGATGLPGINSLVIIQGAGRATTIIERDPNAALPFRLMAISSQSVGGLVLNDVTMRGGRSDDKGGALFTFDRPATLNHVDFTDNTAPVQGGAVSGFQGGGVTVNNCTFTNNRAEGAGAQGGAIVAAAMTVRNSTFTGNTAEHGGGAISYTQSGGAHVDITDCAFLNNSTGGNGGGACLLSGTITIARSTFDGNVSGNVAGALNVSGNVDISDSDVTNNHAADSGAILNLGFTGGANRLTVNRCNISHNTSNRFTGGIHIEGTNASISNSTVSGNTAVFRAGGIYNGGAVLTLTNVSVEGNTLAGNTAGEGGGIWCEGDATTTLNNATITGNQASHLGGGMYGFAGTIVLKNSILALNTSACCGTFGADIYQSTSSLTSLGYNLVGIKDGANFTNAVGDQTGDGTNPINPLLGPLQNNGGPTLTRALLSGSTAIDAANPAAPGSGGDSCATTDQRGRRRPDGNLNSGGRCDIGAFEVAAPPVCTTPPSDMVGWWPFDGNGNDIQDSNQALLFGNPSFAPGKVGQSLSFDGLDDHAQVLAAAALDVGNGSGLTIDAWINPSENSTARPLIEWNNGAGVEGVHLWISADFAEGGQGPGSLFVNLTDTSATHHIFSSAPGLLAANVWQHVAVTYDKTSGVAVIYLNGELVAQQTLGTFTLQTTTDLYFGYRPVGVLAGRRFLGNMDEVELFNRALDVTEVQSIYDADSAGKCKPVPTPSPTPAVIDITEQITVSDAPTLLPSAMIGVSEQINVLDTPTLLPSAMIGVNEQINVLDTPTLLPSAMIGVNEQINVLDTPTLLPSAMIGVNENITVNDEVSPHAIQVTYANILTAGTTSVVPIDPFSVGPPPNGFTITGPAFDITTTVTYTPPVNVCFNLPSINDPATFLQLKVLHGELNANNQLVLVDRTSGQHFPTRTLCGQVNSLSPFVIAEAQSPTAAPATIGGRVTAGDGATLGGVTMTLSGAQSRFTVTDSQGRYAFENLPTGTFYSVTPSLANYTFAPSSRSYSLVGNQTDAVFAATADAAPTANPLDAAQFFVRQQYLDFLGREPDAGGLAYWSDRITECSGDQACIRSRRIDVSNAFFFEQEYQQTGAYVFRLYRAAFGNDQPISNPDSGNQTEAKKLPSYSVFAADRADVIGVANLAQAQLALANAFVRRAEFLSRYPAALSGPDFVDAVLATITNDNGADLTSQRGALIDLFNAGGRGSVIYRLADDDVQTNPINNREFVDSEYNRAFVFTEYGGYLRRDADVGGFLFWLGQVNRFPLRDVGTQHAMVCSFITSAEYQRRFSAIVTHSNGECGP